MSDPRTGISDDGLYAIAQALYRVANGDVNGPTGLEVLAMAFTRDHDASMSVVMSGGLSQIADAIESGLRDIADAIRDDES